MHFAAYGGVMADVSTPWGRATAVAELTLPPRRDGGSGSVPVVQLLRTREGEELVRFAYTTDGVVRRGPVTVRVRDLARARKALDRVPELRRAIVGE